MLKKMYLGEFQGEVSTSFLGGPLYSNNALILNDVYRRRARRRRVQAVPALLAHHLLGKFHDR